MRLFLALMGGFVLTLAVFAAGIVLATVHLAVPTQERDAPKASETTAMWSDEPVRVAYAPGPTRPRSPDAADAEGSADGSGIGLVTPAAAATEAPKDLQEPERLQQPAREPGAEALATAHLDWCRDRYRSYRPEDNSYRPYGGGRAFCVSPYLEQLAAGEQRPEDAFELALEADEYSAVTGDEEQEARIMYVGGTPAIDTPLTEKHIRYCFDRYRSYRPEDNSYQPYGGGPRRQCL